MVLICRQSPMEAPIVSSYNDKIRPLLDCIDKLRHLKIMQEGIQLPTIVVVGDQSSGKSSVLESLAGISLPRGQGICTRVPLIMRLKNVPNLGQPELHLEFNGKTVPTDEESVAEAIVLATEEVAGRGKGISHAPLTLTVKKCGVPDLTMVDLPGITRVPVHGQPEDIYEQISNIIMEYITPEESIILNVLSASVDFSTCESIRMSQKVDKTGERTLAVKVSADDVHIGLGYVCVRNRIGEESYEEARMEEAKLFQSHPFLSKIEKSMVSIPVLAQKLVRIQANIISKCLPEIVRKINDKLTANMADLNRLPKNLSTVAEALTTFLRIISSAKESLRKILVRGEFDEYPDEEEMHCKARLVEMLDEYAEDLRVSFDSNNFLMEEILALEETKEISLPNFLPRRVFLSILHKRVKAISTRPEDFVAKLWDYIEKMVVRVWKEYAESYPQLLSSMKRASQNLIAKMKQKSVDWVQEIIGMEMMADYSCNPEYSATWSKLMVKQGELMERLNDSSKGSKLNIDGNKIEISHLRGFGSDAVCKAFDMRMRIIAYWKIVLMRLVDSMALHVLYSIQTLVNRELEEEVVGDLMAPHGGGIERMLGESQVVAEKRYRLSKSVKLLMESKDVVANIMDRIVLADG
ncbi:PREDICTED: dynamin-related protein 4C-like [Ipomoea nil]|uniref:dynamin-related protein 4C-like n=1 Tax=Ipomoea nil TaxID=35883 RepID=UPI000901A238|nr:PREDICTED: dynamin-related protein 4C-like [Ipomoea nil]